jgi:hypothetical protein
MTRRVKVEIFDPASTRDKSKHLIILSDLYNRENALTYIV